MAVNTIDKLQFLSFIYIKLAVEFDNKRHATSLLLTALKHVHSRRNKCAAGVLLLV